MLHDERIPPPARRRAGNPAAGRTGRGSDFLFRPAQHSHREAGIHPPRAGEGTDLSITNRYALALALIAGAVLLRLALGSLLVDDQPYAPLYLAALGAAWWTGRAPALVAALVGYAATNLLWASPDGPATILPADRQALVQGLLYFVRVGVVVQITHLARSARERAQAGERAARERADALERLHAERDRVLAALRTSEERLRGMFRQATVGIAETDRSGRFTAVNDAYCAMVGRDRETLLGLRLHDVTHPDDLPGNLTRFEHLVGTGEGFIIEKRYLRPGGDAIWVANSVYAVQDERGAPQCFVAICVDISARRAAEAERRALTAAAEHARADAEAANRAKDEFLATVSHELRSPLQGILGWLTLLKRGQLDAGQTRRALESVERSVRLQAQLVHDIMDVSRIVAGRIELEREPIDLAALLRTTADEHMPAAVAKRLTLAVHAGACGLLLADRDRLHQVIANLLTNALKFTPPGGRITVGCARVGDEVEVTVADTGDGIDPAFLPHLFERFSQADSSSTRHFGGLGIGLAIVRHLVELHGGRVTAESPGRGHGATFRVRLPAALDEPDELPAAGTAPVIPRLDGVEILLVEDDRDALEAMTFALAASGATVRPADSARAAFDAFLEQPPDLVVSDLSMPEEDGYSLLHRLRSAVPQRRVPAIALTGLARPEDRARALAAGFLAHVSKPVDPDQLIEMLAAIVAREMPSQ